MDELIRYVSKDVSMLILEYLINKDDYIEFTVKDLIIMGPKIKNWKRCMMWAASAGRMDILKHVHTILKNRYKKKSGFRGVFMLIALNKMAINEAIEQGNIAVIRYLGMTHIQKEFWKDKATTAAFEGYKDLSIFLYKKYYRRACHFMKEAIKGCDIFTVTFQDDVGNIITNNIYRQYSEKSIAEQFVDRGEHVEIVKYFKNKCKDTEDHLYHATRLGKVELMKVLEDKYDPDKYLASAIRSGFMSTVIHVEPLIPDTFKAICETIRLDHLDIFKYFYGKRIFSLDQKKKIMRMAMRDNARGILYYVHSKEVVDGEDWNKHMVDAIKRDYVDIVIYILSHQLKAFTMTTQNMIDLAENYNSDQCSNLFTRRVYPMTV